MDKKKVLAAKIFSITLLCIGLRTLGFLPPDSTGKLPRAQQAVFLIPATYMIPVAVSAFPDEIYAAPKSWAVKAYPKLIYYNKLNKGGHFAAWEQPELFTEEMRAAFKSLR